jgi:Ferric reductase like transmembrane component
MLSLFYLSFVDTKSTFKSISKILIYFSLLVLFAIPFGLKDQFEFGKLLGIGSLFSFVLTTLPGSLRRFGVKGVFRQIQILLTYVRAQLGILMFLLASAHYIISFLYPYLSIGEQPPTKWYTIFSAFAFYLAFPLFVTSNSWSRKYLKRNWQRLHNLTYLIIWFIFLHVALQGDLILTFIILLTAILQISSFGYSYLTKSGN